MIPVDQDIFGDKQGNCWAACLASILELPLVQVPNFCVESGDWFRETQGWLEGLGLFGIEFTIPESGSWIGAIPQKNYCILTGKSPRGDFDHCIVGRVSEESIDVVHDPHPSRDLLDGLVKFAFFIGVIDPAIYPGVIDMRGGRCPTTFTPTR